MTKRMGATFELSRGSERRNLAILKQAKTALVCNAGSGEEAQAIVAFVRRELPIL